MIDAFFIALLAPQIISYLSDIILILLAAFFFRSKKILLFLIALTLMIAIKGVIGGDYYVLRLLLPMLRPFVVLGIIMQWIKLRGANDRDVGRLRFWLLLTVLLTTAVNIIGYTKLGDYMALNNWWNGDARLLGETDNTVASVASLQGRYSSIFAQPATAGLAFFCMLYGMIIIRSQLPRLVFFLGVIAVLFSGLVSASSFFSAAILLYALFISVFALLPRSDKKVLFVIMIAAPTFITLFMFSFGFNEVRLFDEDVLGSRFQETSYLHQLVSSLDWTDYFFGVDGFQESGLRVGDNAILMRVVLSGGFFHVLYLGLLTILLLKIIKEFVPREHLGSIFSFYAVIGFGELGFTSLSQPGVVFLVFIPIVLFHVQHVESFQARECSPCVTDCSK